MLDWLRERFSPPAGEQAANGDLALLPPEESIRRWRGQLLRGILRVCVGVGGVAVVSELVGLVADRNVLSIVILLVVYALVVLVAFWSRVSLVVQSVVLLALFYVMGVYNLYFFGRSPDSFLFLLTVPNLATLFLGRRSGRVALVVGVGTLMLAAWLTLSGSIPAAEKDISINLAVGRWVSTGLVFFLLGLVLLLSEEYLFRHLIVALGRSHAFAQGLEARRDALEQQMTVRTAELERRTRYMEATTDVARVAASVLDPQELLDRVVNLISERFGFYHTGIFLIDSSGEWAVLQAASSAGGQRMLERGHRLGVGQTGTVGYVTQQGKPRIALDVGEDAVFFNNPDLPDTRSAITLPLRARGNIIGALDVQSTESGAFSNEDTVVLQALADQVALAISNARLFQQSEERLVTLRRAYGEASRAAWAELFKTRAALGFVSSERGIATVDAEMQPEMAMVARSGQAVLEGPVLLLPIQPRDQVLGVVRLRKPEARGAWTTREISLMESLAEQLGVALESARLYQDTQRGATRDRMIGEFSAQMRQSLDVDAILQSAVTELRQALELDGVEVHMRAEMATDESLS